VKKEIAGLGFNKRMLEANVKGLKKLVSGLKWRAAQSTWSEYATSNSYTDADRTRKESFVLDIVASRPWSLVWDLGCNTGTFSRIAARNAETVVAMDADHLAVERLYQSLKTEGNKTILPLVNNLADSSPGLGWRGKERVPLPARGRPQLTLCLALIHHLVLGANIPLSELIEWLAALGTNLIIEFVDRKDPMVQALLRNKPDIFTDYQPENFERLLAASFQIERREPLESGTRTLYYATQRP
jgi:ribosomal protein L11 methylase PrmA